MIFKNHQGGLAPRYDKKNFFMLNSAEHEILNAHKYINITRAPHAGANNPLQLHLENSKSKKGHNWVKKNLRIISPTGTGSPFNSKQLVWVLSKYLQ